MYLHVRVCVRISTGVCICVGICMYTYVYMCMNLYFIYATIYVCGLYVHMYVRMCVSKIPVGTCTCENMYYISGGCMQINVKCL